MITATKWALNIYNFRLVQITLKKIKPLVAMKTIPVYTKIIIISILKILFP